MSATLQSKRNAVESVLSIVTSIKPGEGLTAVLMALNIFTLLAAYYVLKSVREALVTTDLANTGTAIMALLLIPTVKIYGAVARKVTRKKLISYVTAFFISNLFIFYILSELQFRYTGVIFFVWVGIFNNMVIAQFWAYGNDIYNPEQGKRLFPLIMLGSSIGAILGPLMAKGLSQRLGADPLLLVAGAMLMVCIGFTIWIDNREKPVRSASSETKHAEAVLGCEGGFELVWKHRYLLYIALLMILLNIVNTTGEQIRRQTFNQSANASVLAQNPGMTEEQLQRALDAERPGTTEVRLKKAVQGFKIELNSDFFFWVNFLSVLIQGLLVSRILKLTGVRGALLLVPIVVLLGYGTMAFLPSLLIVRSVKIIENSQDYSLMNTLRASLYLPTTRDMKYKAKQVIDTFFVRLGDLIASGIWFLGIRALALSVPGFARLMLGFICVWLILACFICREHKKMVPDEELSAEPALAGAAAS